MELLEDIVLAIRVAVFAAAVPLMSRLPIRKLEARLEPSDPGPFDEARALRTLRVAEGVFRRTRRFISRPCLIRGVTLFYFLRRAGMDVSLVFGIGEVKGQHSGHCWLAREGKPYLETTDPLQYFTPMYAFHAGSAGRTAPIAHGGSYGRP